MATEPALTEAWLPGRDGLKFYTRTYAAPVPRAVAIFVHGFSEHITRYEWAHRLCASKGVTLFAYDERGYGRTALDKVHRSQESAFGKTCLQDGLLDFEWWLKHVRQQFPTLPIFALANSMGGALVLAFVTRPSPPPSKEAVALLSGIISSGTMLYQHQVKSMLLRFVCKTAGTILPNLVINAHIPASDVTRNTGMQAVRSTDVYAPEKGSLKGITDMLDIGEEIWLKDHINYPRSLPIMLLHGSLDRVGFHLLTDFVCFSQSDIIQVTSFEHAQQFIEKLDADDKTFLPFTGGYHELFHEPDGMKEKVVEECTSWILRHAEPPAAASTASE
ncbi:lysophospholipase [Lenzites betulinus]|nr:lysophospholipase [Lenzites betulinus]